MGGGCVWRYVCVLFRSVNLLSETIIADRTNLSETISSSFFLFFVLFSRIVKRWLCFPQPLDVLWSRYMFFEPANAFVRESLYIDYIYIHTINTVSLCIATFVMSIFFWCIFFVLAIGSLFFTFPTTTPATKITCERWQRSGPIRPTLKSAHFTKPFSFAFTATQYNCGKNANIDLIVAIVVNTPYSRYNLSALSELLFFFFSSNMFQRAQRRYNG